MNFSPGLTRRGLFYLAAKKIYVVLLKTFLGEILVAKNLELSLLGDTGLEDEYL